MNTLSFREFVVRMNENHGIDIGIKKKEIMMEKKKGWWTPLSEGKYMAKGSKAVKIMVEVADNQYVPFTLTKEDFEILLKNFDNK